MFLSFWGVVIRVLRALQRQNQPPGPAGDHFPRGRRGVRIAILINIQDGMTEKWCLSPSFLGIIGVTKVWSTARWGLLMIVVYASSWSCRVLLSLAVKAGKCKPATDSAHLIPSPLLFLQEYVNSRIWPHVYDGSFPDLVRQLTESGWQASLSFWSSLLATEGYQYDDKLRETICVAERADL